MKSLTVESLAEEIGRIDGVRGPSDIDLARGLLPFIERNIAVGEQSARDANAWMHEEDPTRVISAKTKASALADAGASASSVRPYTIPLGRLATPQPRVQYDRQSIASMLESGVNLVYSPVSIAEQARLLRAADDAEAAGVRTARREPKPAADVPLPYAWGPDEIDGDTKVCTLKSAIEYGDAREAAGRADAVPATFQARVSPWMAECFGHAISSDVRERGDRLLEEVLELLQSHDYDPARVATLRDYVFGRPVGEPAQEVGGVMVTLAAYCLATGIDMHAAGETELARIWTKVETIRAKQASKRDLHSPLPAAAPAQHPPTEGVGSTFPDPLNCRACPHPNCARFDGPQQVECRAMKDNACAREYTFYASPEDTPQQMTTQGEAEIPSPDYQRGWADGMQEATEILTAEPEGREAVAPFGWMTNRNAEQFKARGHGTIGHKSIGDDFPLYPHPAPVADAEALKVGERVEWVSQFGTIFPGKISAVRYAIRYAIDFDDGVSVPGASADQVRRLTGADHGA